MTPDMDKIAVTGGLGFIGSILVEDLIRAGHAVAVIDAAAPAPQQAALGIDFFQADLREAEQVRQIITRLTAAGYRSLVHLAGNADALRSVAEPAQDFRANATATANVLTSAASAGWERAVIVSSALVYGRSGIHLRPETELPDPVFPYSASKLAAEAFGTALSRWSDLQVVVARLFTVYGPSADPCRSPSEPIQYPALALRDEPIIVLGDPATKVRDFVHVRDVVAALRLLLDRGEDGGTYNVGTGVATSLYALLSDIGKQLGRPVRWQADMSDLTDSYSIVADISRISRLGFRPAVALHDALASVLAAGSAPRPVPESRTACPPARPGARVPAGRQAS